MPKPWIVANKVKKGDELEITEQGNRLIISTEESGELLKTRIDVTDLDRTSIVYYIRNAYRRGYDVIEINYKNPETHHLRTSESKKISSIIHEEVSRLVGVEVIQQKENSCLIKTISKTSAEDFQNILRRIFILLTDFGQDMATAYKDVNKDLLESAEEKHDNITKFISYSLRLLNKKSNYPPTERTMMFHVIASLERIVDTLKWGGRRGLKFRKKKFSKRTVDLIERIMQTINMYYDFFYKFDINKVGKIYQHRHNIREEIDNNIETLPAKEAVVVSEFSQILETIVALIEIKMGMELE